MYLELTKTEIYNTLLVYLQNQYNHTIIVGDDIEVAIKLIASQMDVLNHYHSLYINNSNPLTSQFKYFLQKMAVQKGYIVRGSTPSNGVITLALSNIPNTYVTQLPMGTLFFNPLTNVVYETTEIVDINIQNTLGDYTYNIPIQQVINDVTLEFTVNSNYKSYILYPLDVDSAYINGNQTLLVDGVVWILSEDFTAIENGYVLTHNSVGDFCIMFTNNTPPINSNLKLLVNSVDGELGNSDKNTITGSNDSNIEALINLGFNIDITNYRKTINGTKAISFKSLKNGLLAHDISNKGVINSKVALEYLLNSHTDVSNAVVEYLGSNTIMAYITTTNPINSVLELSINNYLKGKVPLYYIFKYFSNVSVNVYMYVDVTPISGYNNLVSTYVSDTFNELSFVGELSIGNIYQAIENTTGVSTANIGNLVTQPYITAYNIDTIIDVINFNADNVVAKGSFNCKVVEVTKLLVITSQAGTIFDITNNVVNINLDGLVVLLDLTNITIGDTFSLSYLPNMVSGIMLFNKYNLTTIKPIITIV